MPASQSSLRITEAYRTRLFGLRSQLERRAELLWPTIEGLDDFTWTNKAAAATQNAQREAVALTGAYLSAFLSSEVGTRTRGPILDTRRYSGLSRDGRPLRDALRSPMIGVRFKLKEGATPEEALAYGLHRAKRMVSVDYDHAHRTALLDGLAADERFQGWQRAVTGTCGACAGDIAVEVSTNLPSIPLQVHPNCQCVTEPVVTTRQPGIDEGEKAVLSVVDVERAAVRELDPDDIATARYNIPEKVIEMGEGKAETVANSLTHEYGHYIDDLLGDFTGTAGGLSDEMYQALKNSRTMKAVRNDEIEILAGDIQTRNYMLQGREMFARAFHQYVTVRSGNPILRQHMDNTRNNDFLGFQYWQDDEFEPIAALFDRLFAERGLAR
jgi:hypothetical protein